MTDKSRLQSDRNPAHQQHFVIEITFARHLWQIKENVTDKIFQLSLITIHDRIASVAQSLHPSP